ncbi:unnamed protein product [Closterium sp. NIES-53]
MDPSSTMTSLLAVEDDDVEDIPPPSAPSSTSPLPLAADLPKTASPPATPAMRREFIQERRAEELAEAKLAEEPTAEDRLNDDASSDVVEVLGSDEGELSAREQSNDIDVVEVPVEVVKPRRSTHSNLGKPAEELIYHACLTSTSYSTLLDDAEADVNMPKLDPDMHADPEHHWDIANMMVKEALAS